MIAYMHVPAQGLIGSMINIYGAIEAKSTISAEFMNGIYNYIGYYLTFGNYPLFICLFTFAMYMFVFAGLYHFAYSIREKKYPIICGVLIVSFFYMCFSLSVQLQKQNMAQAIMMYVIGRYAHYGKMDMKNWIFAALSLFTHQSTVFFIPFLIWKPFRRKLTRQSLFAMAGMILLLVMAGPSLAGSVISGSNGDASILSYAGTRLANSESTDDGLSINPIHILYMGVPTAFILVKRLCVERKLPLAPSEAFVLNVVLFLLVSVAGMFKQSLTQYRYFFMVPYFLPFVYPYISPNVKTRNMFLKCMALLMVVTFYINFPNLQNSYAALWEIILKSPIIMLLTPYWPYWYFA